jgi:hypothetical protein
MNTLHLHLEFLLRVAAVGQLAIAALNLFLVRIMNWRPDLERAPLLIREVFHIHCMFISITLTIFGVLTWQFAQQFASALNPLAVWLAVGIGAFWGIRSVMQWAHYSPSHWRGNVGRTLIHFALFFGYAAFATVYFAAAFWRNT